MTFARCRGSGLTLRILAVLTLVGLTTNGCGKDGGTQPEPTATVQFSATLPSFPDLVLSNGRVSVEDGSGTVVATTSAQLTAGQASFSATVEVTGTGSFTYLIELLDGSTVMYESPSGTLQGGSDQQITVSEFSYVGPGADVASIEIDLQGRTALRIGQEITAEANLLDGSGSEILSAPVHWSVANGDLELVEAYTSGGHLYADFRALTSTESESIQVTTPAEVDGSASLGIVEPVLGDVVLQVTLPRFPGLQPDSVVVELTGDVAKDTTIELINYPPVLGPTTVDVELVIPVDVTFDASYSADVTFKEHATDLYSATAVAVTGDGTGVPVALDYIGPGADASTVEITLGKAEAMVGDSTVATATAKDADGAVLAGVPFAWTLASPGLEGDPVELRQGLAEITVQGGLTAGAFDVTAETPTGVTTTVTFTLTAPAGDSIYIDFSTYPDGSTTSKGPLGNEYAEWGVIFGFVPYTSATPVTGMPNLNKDSHATTAWIENGKTTYGTPSFGFFEIEFTGPVTKVATFLNASSMTPSDRYTVLDTDGNVVTEADGVTFSQTSGHDTVEYEAGISKIFVETGQNQTVWILDLSFK